MNRKLIVESELGGSGPTQISQAAASPAKLLIKVKDAAYQTSLSEKSILRLIQRGKIRCLSGVRHKMIPAAELARFIRDNLS